MCGILAVLGLQGDVKENRVKVLRASKKQRHRGPDATSVYASPSGSAIIAFERLNIVDVTEAGRQPFVRSVPGGHVAWALNSEIYNHEALREQHLAGVHIPTTSDSAIIGYMYDKMGDSDALWSSLDGIFACVLFDERTGEFCAARDAMGICSFYWGKGKDGSLWFASEMKALQDNCETFDFFPPGHCYRSSTGKLERWFKPSWIDESIIPKEPLNLLRIRETLISSVLKRLMSDAPLGVLLSGGLDSSLVASIAVRHLKESKNAYDTQHKLHTFSVGLAGSPDLAAARKVADFLGTIHHEFTFTVQEGLDALEDLIWHIESIEQVRAAVPMYILARNIKAMGIKVVLSGEGADEALGGYLFFHKAPSPEALHSETVRLLNRLHQWDVLRANKTPFAWGVETRVPFLDKAFLELVMNIDPKEKMIDLQDKPDKKHARLEKYLLRKAFDTPEEPYLPDEVLYRQKEQFSDGVGYDWVDGLKDYAAGMVSDASWEARAQTFPEDTPRTREYYLLRSIFAQYFPHPSAWKTVPKGLSIACSTPAAIAWDAEWAGTHEISGRVMKTVHEAGAHLKDAGESGVAATAREQEDDPLKEQSIAAGITASHGHADNDDGVLKSHANSDSGGLNNLAHIKADGSVERQ